MDIFIFSWTIPLIRLKFEALELHKATTLDARIHSSMQNYSYSYVYIPSRVQGILMFYHNRIVYFYLLIYFS